MDDVVAGVATVPGRTGDIPPVRPPVAMRASGFGVVGRTVAMPRQVVVMLEWLWSWPASRSRRPSWPASWSR